MERATTRFRRLIAGQKIVMAPGCHDALGAYFAQLAGFAAVSLTGYGMACSLLGRPDLGELTMSEITAHAARVAAAVDIPVVCDADTGYGGPLNVQRTVREFERAGVAAIHIEDQVEPKRCAAMAGMRVADLPTAITRIKAAVAAKRDPDFTIIARTDARPSLGVEGAIERVRAFARAGADMVYVELLRSREEVEQVASALEGVPLVFDRFELPGIPVFTAAELEALGFRLVLFPMTSTLAYAKALSEVYGAIRADDGNHRLTDRRLDLHAFEDILCLKEIRAGVSELEEG